MLAWPQVQILDRVQMLFFGSETTSDSAPIIAWFPQPFSWMEIQWVNIDMAFSAADLNSVGPKSKNGLVNFLRGFCIENWLDSRGAV